MRPNLKVELVQVRQDSAPVQLSAMGSVASPHTVNVRPQVSGTLTEVYFTEGDSVEEGQKLFRIDPAPYQAAMDQTRGQLARDRASAASARAQRDRLEPLFIKDYATPQEYEDARAAAAEAEAVVASDSAMVRNAQINLDRTLIKAPIAGRSGSLAVKAGNVIAPSDTDPLVVINRIDQVEVEFSIPQTSLPDVQAALAAGPVEVLIRDERGGRELGRGRLVFVDNMVGATTGTVRLKAQADNPEGRMWPGAFVNATVVLRVEPNVLLLPETAVQTGADGPYVYLVEDGKAVLHNIHINRQVGADVVVTDGLSPGQSVISKVPRGLSPGAAVSPVGAPEAPTGGSDAPARGGRGAHGGLKPQSDSDGAPSGPRHGPRTQDSRS